MSLLKSQFLRLLKNEALLSHSALNFTEENIFTVNRPDTLEEIGWCPNTTKEQAEVAISRAQRAQLIWKGKPVKERSSILMKWHDLLMFNQDDLATILTLENGKPIAESKTEIAVAASYLSFYSEEIKNPHYEFYPVSGTTTVLNKYEPVGVCALITPWNFPSSMLARKAAPALVSGCSIIAKPDPQTPYSAIALMNLAIEAGLPEHLFQVIPACPKTTPIIGELLATHPSINKLSFTGSTSVGKLLMNLSSSTVKRLSLELGGHAPLIVFDDVDIDNAVESIIKSRFRNAGQTCICANRIFIQKSIYEKALQKLIELIKTFKIGSGLLADTNLGPLINHKARQTLLDRLRNAVEEGAKIVYGGNALSIEGMSGAFMEPTILSEVPCDSNMMTQEVFGPIAIVIPFETEEEAIEMANISDYGLAGYIFTKDIGRALRLSDKLEVGMVGINEIVISMADAPFGGIKQSGFGREGSKHGLFEYMYLKTIHLR